jgi:putative RecB family exonuclease
MAPAVVAPRRGSLSPSRAADFMSCPLLYRFRVIDQLPEAPSPEATRGTVVHAVLQRLFDLEPALRTRAAADDLLLPEWERLRADEPELATLFADDAELENWLASARDLLDSYFALEDPTRLQPQAREWLVEVVLESGLRLRGYVDRVDRSPAGDVRIVDYKTGRSPTEAFEGKALFQLKFYALVIWRSEGVLPRLLQLIYLDNREVLRYVPDESDLLATERKLEALWVAIERAWQNRDWRPRPGPLCGWCAHRALCPSWGGTPPPLPVVTLPTSGADPVLVEG